VYFAGLAGHCAFMRQLSSHRILVCLDKHYGIVEGISPAKCLYFCVIATFHCCPAMRVVSSMYYYACCVVVNCCIVWSLRVKLSLCVFVYHLCLIYYVAVPDC